MCAQCINTVQMCIVFYIFSFYSLMNGMRGVVRINSRFVKWNNAI